MRKILLIGKSNTPVKKFLNYMMDEMDMYIQYCGYEKKAVENVVSVFEPDVVVINLIGYSESDKDTCAYIFSEIGETRTILCGTEFDVMAFKKHFYRVDHNILTKPYTDADICNMIPTVWAKYKKEMDEEKAKKENEQQQIEKLFVHEEKKAAFQSKMDTLFVTRGNLESKIKILLVDDNAIQLRTLRGVLSKDYDISLATSGMQALKVMESVRPDIVFLDIEMPGMNGPQVYNMAKSNENIKDIPIVFLTGEKEKNAIMDVMRLNPAGYLVKPPDIDKLREIVTEVVG